MKPENCTVGGLLDKVDHCFCNVPDLNLYKYHLGPIGGKWRFHVINSWNNWFTAGLQFEFEGSSPKEAMILFLKYVDEHDIDCGELSRNKW